MCRVDLKSSLFTTFVEISSVLEDFCVKFYTIVKQSDIHFTIKFGWKMTKLYYFNQDNSPASFLGFLSIVFTASLLVAVKRASLLVLR